MKKVTIEITEKGWETTVQIGDYTAKEKHVITTSGSRGESPFLEDDPEIDEDLSEAIHDLTVFETAEVCEALRMHPDV